jgi:signal transduction histidine kinase/ligand-binding sensor domain-containing protein
MLLERIILSLAVIGPVWADPLATPGGEEHIAEAGLPFIRNFDPVEYGAVPQNWAIAQDHEGVIYVGNNDAILAFDGTRWQRIAIPNHSIARALAADGTGRIFVGAVGELGYLAPDVSGQIHYVSLLDRIPQEDRGFTDVWQVFTTDDGVFFSTHTCLFRLRGDRVTVWKTAASFHMTFWARGALFVRETGRGLLQLIDDQLVPVSGGEIFATEKIYAVLPWGKSFADKTGELLIGTRTQGWFVFDGTTYRPWMTEADAALKRDKLYEAIWLADGTLAVATLQGGVSLLDDHGHLLRHLTKDNGLANNTIYALFQDRQRGLWLALDSGISRIDLGSPITHFDERSGLPGMVLALQRYTGHLYVGTAQSVFRLDTDAEGGARFVQIQGVPGRANAFLKLDDSLLVATTEGVFEIGHENSRLVRTSAQSSDSLLQSRRDPARVFVGLQDGIASIRLENGRWVDEGRIPDITAESLTLFEEPDGRLWLGDRNGGAERLSVPRDWAGGSDAAHTVHVERFGSQQGLPVGWTGVWKINNVVRFTSGSGGLFQFDGNDGRFVPDPQFTSLFPLGPRKEWPLYEDSGGRVWMATIDPSSGVEEAGAAVLSAGGIYHWIPTPLQPISGRKIEAIYGDPDGVLWFGANKGLFRYDAGLSIKNDSLFVALVRTVVGRNGNLNLGGMGQHAMPRIPYADNALRFEFAAPSYDSMEANRFQVFLEGLDHKWSAWTGEAYRDYNSLPENDYRFRVRARNVYGVVSEEASYAFRILPPWYRTWWAKLVMVLVGAIAIATLIQGRTTALRRRQRELKRQVEARTAEVVHQKEIAELRKVEVEQQKAVAEQQTAVAEHQKAAAELAHRNISLLSEIGRLITASLDPEAIMDTLHEHVEKLMDASVFGIGLCDLEHDLIRIPYAMVRGKRFAPYTRSLSEPNQLAVWCIRHAQEVFINDVDAELGRYIDAPVHTEAQLIPGMSEDGPAPSRPMAIICAPLLVKERVLGVISVQSFRAQAYESVHLDMLRTLAAYTAVALDNADASARLKETQKQLFEQESMALLGRLVAGVAHEINTPLGIGITAASHLEGLFKVIDDGQGVAAPPDVREVLASGRRSIELVLRNLDKAGQLVRTFKQAAVDQSSETKRRVGVSSYLDDVLISLGSRLKKTPHHVEVDCPADLEIDTFPGALYQIVANLVLNALTHAFDNDSAGCIHIGVRRVGKWLEMTFADNGKGMTEDVRRRVFEPFFTTRRGSGGTGLGLHLVYNLVTQLLRGTIVCESSPGQGTQFTLRLPIAGG